MHCLQKSAKIRSVVWLKRNKEVARRGEVIGKIVTENKAIKNIIAIQDGFVVELAANAAVLAALSQKKVQLGRFEVCMHDALIDGQPATQFPKKCSFCGTSQYYYFEREEKPVRLEDYRQNGDKLLLKSWSSWRINSIIKQNE